MSHLLKAILSLKLSMISLLVSGSHIVGGSISYELKDSQSNSYEIFAELFLDCINGDDTELIKDRAIFLAVHDAVSRAYVDRIMIPVDEIKEVSRFLNRCSGTPGIVCVSRYTFRKTVTLNPGENGLIISLQRCCRNKTIKNIIGPANTGFIIWTKIPPKKIKNSSPKFIDLPPNYLCVNYPLVLEQRASDLDGDSLIYDFYSPNNGASVVQRPTREDEYEVPPYRQVIWRSDYGLTNQIASVDGIHLDSKTGRLTFTPSEKGQYVVGYRVLEYRNGLLIGETRRDYQFNVVECYNEIFADFISKIDENTMSTSSTHCTDSIQFINRSRSSASLSYYWDFGVEGSNNDTSTLRNPAFIYQKNGDYKV